MRSFLVVGFNLGDLRNLCQINLVLSVGCYVLSWWLKIERSVLTC